MVSQVFPWSVIILFQIGTLLLVGGIVLYETNPYVKTGEIVIGLSKTPWRTLLIVLLILSGSVFTAVSVDIVQADPLLTYSNIVRYGLGGGGASLPANICTNSTIGTSGCLLPSNGCDGVLRSYGRCNSGTNSCTINAGQNSCVVTNIVYGTAFSNNPYTTVGDKPAAGTAPAIATITTISPIAILAAATPVVWSGMPAVVTELFGNVNGENQMAVDWSGAPTVAFEVNCVAGSISATAVLQLQYLSSDGVTWVNIASSINVSNVSCPNGGYLNGSPTAYVATPTVGQVNLNDLTKVPVRVVGQNGAGGADAPSFTKIEILQKTSTTIANIVHCFDSTTLNLLTTIKVTCLSTVAPGTGQTTIANFKWQAWSYAG